MTPKAQIKAIVEVCGWTELHPDAGGGYMATGLQVGSPLHDLNACHEARKVLTKAQYWAYVNYLVDLTHAEWTDSYDEVFVLVNAEAHQHCEALLRTLGKWRDAP